MRYTFRFICAIFIAIWNIMKYIMYVIWYFEKPEYDANHFYKCIRTNDNDESYELYRYDNIYRFIIDDPNYENRWKRVR